MKHVKFEDLPPESQLMAEELLNPKVSIPKEYIPYIWKAVCHYDMYEDCPDNDAFHYLYRLCREHGCT